MSAHPDVVDALEKARARADERGAQAVLVILVGGTVEGGRSTVSIGVGGSPELADALGEFSAALGNNMLAVMQAFDPTATITTSGEVGR